MSSKNIKSLAFCAMAIALATVLSYIKLFQFPTGGSVTLLSMLAICLPGYFFGAGIGIISGIAYGILQFILDPFVVAPIQVFLDYICAFGALGIAGVFKSDSRFGLIKGYILAATVRYAFAVMSGYIYFGEYAWEGWGAFNYSLAYNSLYIYPEVAITVVILLVPAVKKAIKYIDVLANEAK